MKATKVRGHECYAYVEFDNGDKLYMGHSRPAFPNVLIRADGGKFRVSNFGWVKSPQEDDARAMIPIDVWVGFGPGWAYCGVENGKLDILHAGEDGVNRRDLYDFLDASDLAEAVINADDSVVEYEEWSDEFWAEFKATGAPI